MKFFKKKKIIYRDDNTPYLIRWNLFECKYFSIKIHKGLVSDDACLHDHPWAFISLILWGGYVEHREISFEKPLPEEELYDDVYMPKTVTVYKEISRIYHPCSVLFRKATDIHRLEVHQPFYSLVITFKKVRDWGFWTPKGFIKWFNYNKSEHC
jgi:hypothetical protein